MPTQRSALALLLSVFLGVRCFAQVPAAGPAAPNPADQPQLVKIVFFTPSDRAVPDGVQHRLTQIADAAELFLFTEMNRLGYPAGVKRLFARGPDGQVEVLHVQGDQPAASGKYAKPDHAPEVIRRATEQYHVTGEGNVWWIFVYLGDRPAFFKDWHGTGDVRAGGWAMINYDSVPGEIRPELSFTTGFNRECRLKSTIHELGHAFGLPHLGPDPTLGLGNSLMGPNPGEYATRFYPHDDRVYLSAAAAAMLWRHPIFSGRPRDGFAPPRVKLVDYQPVFNAADNTVTINGRVVATPLPHSVVLLDTRGSTDEYWFPNYASRLASDGTFRLTINQPAKTDGVYLILFCFDNGLVSGDGAHATFEKRGQIQKFYAYREGQFHFAP